MYCVIIGFANFDISEKRLFEYQDIKGEAHELKVRNINPYLVDAKDILITNRASPISDVPRMRFGNMPLDGGFLLMSDIEKIELISVNPSAKEFIRQVTGSQEYINNELRWCLWLKDVEPNQIKKIPEILKRVAEVKRFRQNSIAPSTNKFASTPTLFRDTNLPSTYIIIPGVSSENRSFIPMGFLTDAVVPTNLVHILQEGRMFHFGILTSTMHMAWVKTTCGRLKSDFRYSKDIVYNNFPWPQNPNKAQTTAIESAAQKVLDVRMQFPDSSLADLYHPLTMPPALVKAHNELDKTVDLAYRKAAFKTEADRMVFLFELYEKYIQAQAVKPVIKKTAK